jgi:hypothetical protein
MAGRGKSRPLASRIEACVVFVKGAIAAQGLLVVSWSALWSKRRVPV